jgi:hypothetical protein
MEKMPYRGDDQVWLRRQLSGERFQPLVADGVGPVEL